MKKKNIIASVIRCVFSQSSALNDNKLSCDIPVTSRLGLGSAANNAHFANRIFPSSIF